MDTGREISHTGACWEVGGQGEREQGVGGLVRELIQGQKEGQCLWNAAGMENK